MRICLECNKRLEGKYKVKFCDSACAAKFNNKNRINKKLVDNSELIENLISKGTSIKEIIERVGVSRSTFRAAYPLYTRKGGTKIKPKRKQKEVFLIIEQNIKPNPNNTSQNQKIWLKRFLIDRDGAKCSVCDWGEANPTTGNVMVEIDHIDGNPHNNILENVRLLCPNCHSLTPTFRNTKR